MVPSYMGILLKRAIWSSDQVLCRMVIYVCRLRKFLDGLKQMPRALYEKIDNFFLQLGFHVVNQITVCM